MYEYEEILVEDDGPIGIVTLNHPERMNAWRFTTGHEMRHAIAAFDARDDIRAIIVTGAGRAFTAGADMSAEAQALRGQHHPAMDLVPATDAEYWDMGTPIIAAMNGAAVGIGMSLTITWDFRVMAEDAKYGFVFNRRGLLPEVGSTWVLPRLIGVANAVDLMLTGRIFTGKEAKAMGLANDAVPADKVLDRAKEIANEIADYVAPVSTALTKRMIYQHLLTDDRVGVRKFEQVLFDWALSQDDAKEGFQSFFEKRKPQWKLGKTSDFPQDLYSKGI